MTVGISICTLCAHHRLGDHGEGAVCDAFPGGIPALIAHQGFDHRHPHPEDNGIRFAPRTGVTSEKVERILALNNHSRTGDNPLGSEGCLTALSGISGWVSEATFLARQPASSTLRSYRQRRMVVWLLPLALIVAWFCYSAYHDHKSARDIRDRYGDGGEAQDGGPT